MMDITNYKNMTDNILKKVVILPVECGDTKQALKIFGTINNRGLSLEDSDIFKSILYQVAQRKQKQDVFRNKWDSLEQESEEFYNNALIRVK